MSALSIWEEGRGWSPLIIMYFHSPSSIDFTIWRCKCTHNSCMKLFYMLFSHLTMSETQNHMIPWWTQRALTFILLTLKTWIYFQMVATITWENMSGTRQEVPPPHHLCSTEAPTNLQMCLHSIFHHTRWPGWLNSSHITWWWAWTRPIRRGQRCSHLPVSQDFEALNPYFAWIPTKLVKATFSDQLNMDRSQNMKKTIYSTSGKCPNLA